ncbi:MAG: cysC [Mucilaginibacter sp.]|nr:cysC [Mucilaginibacter sp.]
MSQPIKTKAATALWFTGLSGSGKSTLAGALKKEFEKNKNTVTLFDGDVLRKGLNSDLGFSLKDRFENIRRVAEVNNLFLDLGISTINAFISPTDDIRRLARNIIGKEKFFEIYLSTPLEVCMERDPKGLYKRIANGEIKNFTGIDAIFEPSSSCDLVLDTSKISLENSVELILSKIPQFN